MPRTPCAGSILLVTCLLYAAALPAAEETVIRLQTPDIPITVRMELPQSRQCQSEIALSYAQVDTVARVEGELNNSDCAASQGEYTVAVSVRDANGATQTTEFTETWQRTDAAPLLFERDYPIGANVDLLRVRTRRITCTCAEAPAAADAPAAAAALPPTE